MIWTIPGLILGMILGMIFDIKIPESLTVYIAVIILSIIDALLNSIIKEFKYTGFNLPTFFAGLIFNIIFSIIIIFLGERLLINLYLALNFVFIYRIFKKAYILQFYLVEYISKKFK